MLKFIIFWNNKYLKKEASQSPCKPGEYPNVFTIVVFLEVKKYSPSLRPHTFSYLSAKCHLKPVKYWFPRTRWFIFCVNLMLMWAKELIWEKKEEKQAKREKFPQRYQKKFNRTEAQASILCCYCWSCSWYLTYTACPREIFKRKTLHRKLTHTHTHVHFAIYFGERERGRVEKGFSSFRKTFAIHLHSAIW